MLSSSSHLASSRRSVATLNSTVPLRDSRNSGSPTLRTTSIAVPRTARSCLARRAAACRATPGHNAGAPRGSRVRSLLPRRYFAARCEHRVIAGLTEQLVQLATPHALVAAIVEGEDHGVAHDPLQRSKIFGVTRDPYDAH